MKFIIGALSLFSILHAQVPELNVIDNDSFPLFVRSVTLIDHQFSLDPEKDEGDDTLYDPIVVSILKFDKKGNTILHRSPADEWPDTHDTTWFAKDNSAKYEKSSSGYDDILTTTLYNKDGTIHSVQYDCTRHEDGLYEYAYNKNKQVVRMTYTCDSYTNIEERTYAGDGTCTRIIFSSSRDMAPTVSLRWEKLFTQDKTGKTTHEVKLMYSNGAVKTRDSIAYWYDTLGRVWIKKEYRNGKEGNSCLYKYDERNRIVGTHCDNYVITSYQYDEQGYLQQINAPDGEEQWQTTYNEKGLPVKCIYTHGEEIRIYTWKYEYW